jgi:hypothetical protein
MQTAATQFLTLKNFFMGKIPKGILGGFSGTVGPIVGASWNGIDYIRSKPHSEKRIPSPAQQAQQACFGLMVRFLKPMKELLDLGFTDKTRIRSGPNLALSYNIRNAVTGVYPDLTIDPAGLTLTRGYLPNAAAPAVSSTGTGLLHFTWKDNSGAGRAKPGDKAILIAYAPASGKALYNCKAAFRHEQKGILAVPDFSGMKAETYISFIAENGATADSLYTGPVTVL